MNTPPKLQKTSSDYTTAFKDLNVFLSGSKSFFSLLKTTLAFEFFSLSLAPDLFPASNYLIRLPVCFALILLLKFPDHYLIEI